MRDMIRLIKAVDTGITAVNNTKDVCERVKKFYDGRKYTVSVPATERMYRDVHTWALGLSSSRPPRNFKVKTRRAYNNETRDQLHYLYDGGKPVTVNVDGHRVSYVVTKPNSEAKGLPLDDAPRDFLKMEVLRFESRTKEGIDAVRTHIERISSQQGSRDMPPSLNVWGKWSYWNESNAPLRSMDSIILPKGQKEHLINDLKFFLNNEEEYARKGLDWHRGYLLWGPPGTGKTSLVKAIAGEFGLNVYFLSLSDIKSDSALVERMTEIPPKSVVLFEDIDSVAAAKSRKSEKERVTLGGILNVLDGVFTPHGMICVMTTNHPEELDDALIRPGRVDMRLEMTYCDEHQVNEYCSRFYGLDPATRITVPDKHEVSMADVSEAVKSHMHNAEGGLQAVAELFTEDM